MFRKSSHLCMYAVARSYSTSKTTAGSQLCFNCLESNKNARIAVPPVTYCCTWHMPTRSSTDRVPLTSWSLRTTTVNLVQASNTHREIQHDACQVWHCLNCGTPSRRHHTGHAARAEWHNDGLQMALRQFWKTEHIPEETKLAAEEEIETSFLCHEHAVQTGH